MAASKGEDGLKRELGSFQQGMIAIGGIVGVAVEASEKALESRGIATELRVDNATKRSFYLRDPDGLLSEYYYRRTAELPDLSAGPQRMRPFLV